MTGLFWIVTLQWVAGPYPARCATVSGEFSAEQAAQLGSRAAAFRAAKSAAEEALGANPGAAVLFYSLEPARLEAVS